MNLHPMRPQERPALRALYRHAFPANERKSWSTLERMAKSGRSELLTIEEDGPVGLLVTVEWKNMVMVDYLAVFPAKRGAGYGEQALELLRRRRPGRAILLEIESTAVPAANASLRMRRKAFYQRCGFSAVARMWEYSMEMELMVCGSATFSAFRDLMRARFGAHFVDDFLALHEMT